MTQDFRIVRAWLLALALAVSLTPQAHAQERDKEAIIREFMEITGAEKISIQMVEAVIPGLIDLISKANANIPQNIMVIVEEEILVNFKDHVSDYLELTIPLYSENHTYDEIQAVVTFYESKTGKKFVQLQPALMRQSILIGQQWGRATALIALERVKKRLAEEGYDIE